MLTLIIQYSVLASLVVAAIVLLKPILWPVIVTFPWNETNDEEDKQTVILAGSYNPPHLGHLAMLEYLSKRYHRVIAVVGFNPNKKYDVTPEQRKALLEAMVKTTTQTNIQIEVVEGYIWRYAKREGATIFFRGIRSWSKDGADERALQILNTWGPLLLGPLVWPVPTMYLEGNPKYNHVSSTLIRDLCKKSVEGTAADDGGDESVSSKRQLTELVPKDVVGMISNFYCKKDE